MAVQFDDWTLSGLSGSMDWLVLPSSRLHGDVASSLDRSTRSECGCCYQRLFTELTPTVLTGRSTTAGDGGVPVVYATTSSLVAVEKVGPRQLRLQQERHDIAGGHLDLFLTAPTETICNDWWRALHRLLWHQTFSNSVQLLPDGGLSKKTLAHCAAQSRGGREEVTAATLLNTTPRRPAQETSGVESLRRLLFSTPSLLPLQTSEIAAPGSSLLQTHRSTPHHSHSPDASFCIGLSSGGLLPKPERREESRKSHAISVAHSLASSQLFDSLPISEAPADVVVTATSNGPADDRPGEWSAARVGVRDREAAGEDEGKNSSSSGGDGSNVSLPGRGDIQQKGGFARVGPSVSPQRHLPAAAARAACGRPFTKTKVVAPPLSSLVGGGESRQAERTVVVNSANAAAAVAVQPHLYIGTSSLVADKPHSSPRARAGEDVHASSPPHDTKRTPVPEDADDPLSTGFSSRLASKMARQPGSADGTMRAGALLALKPQPSTPTPAPALSASYQPQPSPPPIPVSGPKLTVALSDGPLRKENPFQPVAFLSGKTTPATNGSARGVVVHDPADINLCVSSSVAFYEPIRIDPSVVPRTRSVSSSARGSPRSRPSRSAQPLQVRSLSQLSQEMSSLTPRIAYRAGAPPHPPNSAMGRRWNANTEAARGYPLITPSFSSPRWDCETSLMKSRPHRRHSSTSSSHRPARQRHSSYPVAHPRQLAVIAKPHLFLKHPMQWGGSIQDTHLARGVATYVFLTLDEACVVAVPAKRFEHCIAAMKLPRRRAPEKEKGSPTWSGSSSTVSVSVGVCSFLRAQRFFGADYCRGIPRSDVKRVSHGSEEPLLLLETQRQRFRDVSRMICIVGQTHAFLLEATNAMEAAWYARCWDAYLRHRSHRWKRFP